MEKANNDEPRRDLMVGIPRDCITCDAPTCQKRAPSNRCGDCRAAYYCSKECQKAGRKIHIQSCTHTVSRIKSKESDGETTDEQEHRYKIIPPTAIDPKVSCPVCHEQPIQHPVKLACCGHSFCTRCLVIWQRKHTVEMPKDCQKIAACPLCRVDMSASLEDWLLGQSETLERRACQQDDEEKQLDLCLAMC